MIIRLKHESDLEQASKLVSWLNRPTVEKVHVELSWLDKSEKDRVAKKLHNLFNDCGCLWAAVGFVITFVSFFIPTWLERSFSWSAFTYSLLAAIGVAVLAKFFGLRWSFWRLKVWFRRIGCP